MFWYLIIVAAIVLASALLHFSGILKFDTTVHWTAWVVAALVLLNGGWMAFDGGRALIVGDYVTPQSGRYAGQLGPWSGAVSAVGIEPRSTVMKGIFLVYGLAFVAATAAFLLGAARIRLAVAVLAMLGLWYLPFGTLINLLVLILLLSPPLRVSGDVA